MASSARIDELKKKFDENPRRYFAPLANEFRKAGDIEQAIVICEEFLPQQPGHMSGHIVYGQALYESGRIPESRAVFETALTLDPENLIALRHLGDIALGQGDQAAAHTWYTRVLDADPRNEEIQGLIASMAAQLPSVEVEVDEGFSFAPSSSAGAASPSLVIERDVPLLETNSPETDHGHPQEMPDIPPTPAAPPPLPETDLLEGFSLHGFDTKPDASLTADAHAPALGLESTSFTPPEEKIRGVADLDDSLDSGVPSFEAPAEQIESLAGLQGSGEEVRTGSPVHADLLDFEMPATESRREGAYGSAPDLDLVDDNEVDAPPAELPASVLAAEAELIDLGESPAPDAVSDAEADREDAPTSRPAFVTETMAELYLAQGFKEQALGVYAQLLAANPTDDRLRGIVESLSEDTQQAAPTAREFFARMATRRPGTRAASTAPPMPDDFATFAAPPVEETYEPVAAPEDASYGVVDAETTVEEVALFVEESAPPAAEEPAPVIEAIAPVEEETVAPASAKDPEAVAPAIDRAAAMRTPGGSIDAVFGNRSPSTSEDSAAAALAQAFGREPESNPMIIGRPARAATAELSLDSVFRDGPARPPRTSSSFSFAQFFTGGAATGDTSTGGTQRSSGEVPMPGEPPGERSADDIEQFNSWLQGLKQR